VGGKECGGEGAHPPQMWEWDRGEVHSPWVLGVPWGPATREKKVLNIIVLLSRAMPSSRNEETGCCTRTDSWCLGQWLHYGLHSDKCLADSQPGKWGYWNSAWIGYLAHPFPYCGKRAGVQVRTHEHAFTHTHRPT
jgi:hypothetical protein